MCKPGLRKRQQVRPRFGFWKTRIENVFVKLLEFLALFWIKPHADRHTPYNFGFGFSAPQRRMRPIISQAIDKVGAVSGYQPHTIVFQAWENL
jgi:hypothetical protein